MSLPPSLIFLEFYHRATEITKLHRELHLLCETQCPLWLCGEFGHSPILTLEFILRLLSQSFEPSHIQKFHQGLARVRSHMDLAL